MIGLSPPVAFPKDLREFVRWCRDALKSPAALPGYLVADLPAAADHPRSLVYVSNEAGGAVIAFSDSVNWRRVTDRAICS